MDVFLFTLIIDRDPEMKVSGSVGDRSNDESNMIKLIVEGMTCSGCTSTVTSVLQNMEGVTGQVYVDLDSKIATIPGEPDVNKCIEELELVGYSAKLFDGSSIPIEDKPKKNTGVSTVVNNPITSSTYSRKPKPKPKTKQKKQDGLCTVELSIDGMKCASCVNDIELFVSELEGVSSVKVNLLAAKAVITFNSTRTDAAILSNEITEHGYPSQQIMYSRTGFTRIAIKGVMLDQYNEIVQMIAKFQGVDKVELNLCSQHEGHVVASVDYQPAQIKARDIITLINDTQQWDAEYHTDEVINTDALQRKKEIREYKRLSMISLFFAIPGFIFGMILMWIPDTMKVFENQVAPGLSIISLIMWILATPIQFYIGKSFYIGTFYSLKRLRPTMDVLVALGTSSAYFVSAGGIVASLVDPTFKYPEFFESSIFVIVFIIFGRYLENKAKASTSEALRKLFDLQATETTLLKKDPNGTIVAEEEIDVQLIEEGDCLKVIPGAKIPCDAVVIYGQTTVNEAMITGESLPVKKNIGSVVIGGTINQFGVIHIEATRVGKDTTLSQIIQLVEDAQMSKGETQALADKISGVFVPIVIALSVITFVIWMVLTSTYIVPESWVRRNSGMTQIANMSENANITEHAMNSTLSHETTTGGQNNFSFSFSLLFLS